MSVDYEAFIGIGWVISQEERDKLVERNQALIEQFPDHIIPCIEDEFMWINAYWSDSEVFLGKSLFSADEGSYLNLSTLGTFLTPEEMEEFAEKYTSILQACGEEIGPGTKWDQPQLYLIQRVW